MNTEQNYEEETLDDVSSSEDNSNDYEQNDSTGEGEDATDAEGSDDASSQESPEARRARLRRQVERAAKKEGLSVEEFLGKEKGGESRKESDSSFDEKYLKLDLKTEGITSKKEQEIVLDYLRENHALGRNLEVSDALKSMVVREELAKVRKAASVPKPSSRTSTQQPNNDLEHYAKLMAKGRTREVPLEVQRELRKKRMVKW